MRNGSFPREMWNALAELGYMGLTIPTEYGGTDSGMLALALVHQRLAHHGVPFYAMVAGPGLGILPIVRHGNESQKRQYLPPLATGEKQLCFALTEANAGMNSLRISTQAVRDGNEYVINGEKIFISTVDEANHMLLVARTTPYHDLPEDKKSSGISLFIVELPAKGLTMSELDVQIMPDKQFILYFDNVRVPAENLIGEEGKGLKCLFDGLNPERISLAAICVGLGNYVLEHALERARTRRVFSVPIGAHQGIAHPLAEAKAHLDLAELMNLKAAWAYDRGDDAGAWSNIAKLAAADAALEACDIAIETLGGNAFVRELDFLNIWALARLHKVGPVSREMVLNYLDQRVLHLPRSY